MPGWEPINDEEEFELPPIDPAGAYELWPDNVDAFAAYRGLQTQWRTDQNGLRCGLDYSAALAFLRQTLRDRRKVGDVFDDVRAMEAAALPVHAKLLQEAQEEMRREAEFNAWHQQRKAR